MMIINTGVSHVIMKKIFFATWCSIIICHPSIAQSFTTPFEKSNGKQTATYFECIDHYKRLAQLYPTIKIRTGDTTGAGYPLNVVLFSADKNFQLPGWMPIRPIVVQ